VFFGIRFKTCAIRFRSSSKSRSLSAILSMISPIFRRLAPSFSEARRIHLLYHVNGLINTLRRSVRSKRRITSMTLLASSFSQRIVDHRFCFQLKDPPRLRSLFFGVQSVATSNSIEVLYQGSVCIMKNSALDTAFDCFSGRILLV